MRAAARRPLVTGLIVVALTLLGAAFALRLHPRARTDTLVGKSSASYQAPSALRNRVGDGPVRGRGRGRLRRTVLPDVLDRIIGPGGCVAGHVPSGGTARVGNTG